MKSSLVRRSLRLIVVAAIAAVPVAALSTSAVASSYTVTSTSDDGSSGTLRWAINQANANAGADTIVFDNSVTGTITLTSNLPSVTDDLTITGPGQTSLTIDGTGSYRPFTISTSGKSLTISHMTLKRGTGVGWGPNQGSIIWNTGATVSATSVKIQDDTGVAVFNFGAGSVSTYTNCTFKSLYMGISSDHGNTPSALSNTDTDYQNRTYVVNSTFEDSTYGIYAERFTKVTGSTFTNNFIGAQINGLNRSQILNSTFTGQTRAITHTNWTPVEWTNVGSNNRLIDGNTFTNNSTAMYLADKWNNGRSSQIWSTVTNNTWDGVGDWIWGNYWNGSSNQTATVRTVNSSGREWTESGNVLVAPTTTTTSTTTTSTTTTTTLPAATTTTTASNNTTTTSTVSGDVGVTGGTSTGSSTTIAGAKSSRILTPATTAPETTSTTSTIPSPDAPKVSTGDGAITVDGKVVESTISRENNQLVVNGAGVNATIYGINLDGSQIGLDAEGNLQLSQDDSVGIQAEGFKTDADIEVWLFSSPTQIGKLTTDLTGKAIGTFTLPEGVEAGDHRVVLRGADTKDQDVVVSVGIRYGKFENGNTWTRVLIAIPVSLAVLFGLIIPTTLKRRREQEIAS